MNIRKSIEAAESSINSFSFLIPIQKRINGTWGGVTCKELAALIEGAYCCTNPRTAACVEVLKQFNTVDLNTILQKAKEIS